MTQTKAEKVVSKLAEKYNDKPRQEKHRLVHAEVMARFPNATHLPPEYKRAITEIVLR